MYALLYSTGCKMSSIAKTLSPAVQGALREEMVAQRPRP